MANKNSHRVEELQRQIHVLSFQKETLDIKLARAEREKEELRQASLAFLVLIKSFIGRLDRVPRNVKKAVASLPKKLKP